MFVICCFVVTSLSSIGFVSLSSDITITAELLEAVDIMNNVDRGEEERHILKKEIEKMLRFWGR